MIFASILVLIGFAILIGGAEILVRGSTCLAKRLKVPDIVIGLTIVAFGTSAPEMVVSILSAAKGSPGICFGNVIGSNLLNILLILGICSIIRPLEVKKATTWKEIPFALLTSFVLLVMANDAWFTPGVPNIVSAGDGLILLGFFAIFLVYTHNLSQAERELEESIPKYSLPLTLAFVVGGIISLILGGNLIVTNAVKIARIMGISESVIGLTIVALGTSLPELSTSIAATIKNKADIAVGNVIGSNIFNLLLVMGLSAQAGVLNYDKVFNSGQIVMIIATFLLFIMMFTLKRHRIDRWEGMILLLLYIGYTVSLVR